MSGENVCDMSLKEDFVEDCWFMYGLRIGRFFLGFLYYSCHGTEASVTFDWQGMPPKTLIGWYHTHPGIKSLMPSSMDDQTMRSWVRGLGRPFLCGIICHGEQRCFLYYKKREGKKSSVKHDLLNSAIVGKVVIGWPKP